MRLALIIDDYLPNSTRVGAKMFHELACQLIKNGHEVFVITPGFNQAVKLKKSVLDGVAIWSFRSGKIKDVGKIHRTANETLLSMRAWSAIRSEISPGYFDGIVYYSPSIFFSVLVKKLKKVCGCKSYLVLRDLFPQWAIDQGFINHGSFIEKYFRYFENLNYNAADYIGLMSERNKGSFDDLTTNAYRTSVLRNWANFLPFKPYDIDISYRSKLDLNDKIIYFYGGNIGHAQNMENLMRLVRGMRSFHQAHFLFVGQGDEVELITKLSADWELNNFTYCPSMSQDDFKYLLSEVDVGLFSLAHSHSTHNFPGKLLGYMVQSLPILGSVNPGNDLLDMVADYGAGDVFINGDDESLLNACIAYLDTNYRITRGNAATRLLHEKFSVEAAAAKVVRDLSGNP